MRDLLLFLSPTAIVVLVAIVLTHPAMRINHTQSAPTGLYWLSGTPPAKGDWVSVCLPASPILTVAVERGYLPIQRGVAKQECPQSRQPLLKRLLGQSGDEVSVTAAGIVVNGDLLPNTVIRSRDTQGRALLAGLVSGVIPNGKVLLLSTYSPASFDGRYFGLLDSDAVLTRAIPLVTFTNPYRP